MVTQCILSAGSLLAQAEESTTGFEQLTPLNQLRVIVGLFVVVVLGIVIFLVIKAGSHMMKGYSAAARRLPPDSRPDEMDWAANPLEQTETGEND